MTELDLALAVFGLTVMVLGLLTRWLRQSIVSENILALSVGILVGPLVLNLLDISDWMSQELLLEHVARLTIAVAVMEIALRLPKDDFLLRMKSYAILIGTMMPAMWLASSLLIWLILDQPVWVALLIGAVICPTDPVVATSVVTGSAAERNLPDRLRDALWAESGANDGLAFPFVMLPVLVLGGSFSGAIGEWAFRIFLWETVGGALIGAAVGFGAAHLLRWSESVGAIEHQLAMVYTLALTLTTLGITGVLHTEGILAVFVAGLIFHAVATQAEDQEVEPLQGAIDQSLTIPIFALIGMAIPLQEWIALGWTGVLLVVAVLLLRRIPSMLIVYRWVQPIQSRADALFLGWFGPIGIAALYYAVSATEHTGREVIWVAGSLIICASIIVHGATAAPFTRIYGRRTGHQATES